MVKDLKDEDVLITGGLGFYGSNVARRLVSLGSRITLMDSMLPEYGANMANIAEIRDQAEVVKADIRDYERLSELVRAKTLVVNCAAQVSHQVHGRPLLGYRHKLQGQHQRVGVRNDLTIHCVAFIHRMI